MLDQVYLTYPKEEKTKQLRRRKNGSRNAMFLLTFQGYYETRVHHFFCRSLPNKQCVLDKQDNSSGTGKGKCIGLPLSC